MSESSGNPTTKYPQPKFAGQTQMDSHPGLESAMDPNPDYGYDSYRGSGRLEGKKTIVTGRSSASRGR